MFGPVGPVRITLGTVVLDSPDRSGRYIAKDMVGGWAYLIADKAGDTWARSQGGCPGGLDVQLRCAFLLAASQVPDSQHITILVETRQAHQAMVRLARYDVHVAAAIAGRPVAVTTKPDERSSFQVRAAAERAAAVMLRDREDASLLERPPLKELASYADDAANYGRMLNEETPQLAPDRAAAGWRSGLETSVPRPDLVPPRPARGASARLVSPASIAAALPAKPQSPGLSEWLRDFNRRVASICPEDKEEKR